MKPSTNKFFRYPCLFALLGCPAGWFVVWAMSEGYSHYQFGFARSTLDGAVLLFVVGLPLSVFVGGLPALATGLAAAALRAFLKRPLVYVVACSTIGAVLSRVLPLATAYDPTVPEYAWAGGFLGSAVCAYLTRPQGTLAPSRD